MKILKLIQEFEITVSGGFAIYALMCIVYVTVVGLIQIGQSIIRLFK